MQEVFDKIIAKLGIRAEKSEKKEMDARYFEDAKMYTGERCAFGDAIEIVKQAAAEYNNGWISCSERLPEEHDSMFARFKGTDKWRDSMFEKTSNEVIVTIADEKGEKATTHAHTTDGTWKCDILRACPTYRVIAWQPLPAPYNQHICTNNDCTFNEGKDCPAKEECAGYERKYTNADRIRSMSDEELAEFLCKVKSDYQWLDHKFPSEEESEEWVEWLQSEVEE